MHKYCFNCIIDWSNQLNKCPLCNKSFYAIIKDSNSSINQELVEVEEILFETISLNCDENCYVCNSNEREDKMLICDNCNFRVCHNYCLNPPINNIPEEEWICSYCK